MSGAARTAPLLALLLTLTLWVAAPAPAAASPAGALCSLSGFVSGVLGKVCTVATHAGRVISAGQKLAGGHVGGALGALTGSSTVKRAATTALGLAAIATAVVSGARYALRATAAIIASTTRPNLRSTWFSSFYWRMAAVSALLTLPFLCAAAVQALLRSDLTLLARAAFGYLPLGLLAVGVAAPLTMLLLAGSDEMSSIVSSASGNAGAAFLDRAGGLAGAITAVSGDVFVMFFVGLLTAAATIALWIELLIRQAAVYVIVLMLPLFFAALVWPARRIWAARAVELLVALILSKFAIVSVLALGGAALGHSTLPGLTSLLSGATLVLLAAFTPWALLRLLPLHELAGAAAGGLSGARQPVIPSLERAHGVSDAVTPEPEPPITRLPALMETNPDVGDDRGTDAPGTEVDDGLAAAAPVDVAAVADGDGGAGAPASGGGAPVAGGGAAAKQGGGVEAGPATAGGGVAADAGGGAGRRPPVAAPGPGPGRTRRWWPPRRPRSEPRRPRPHP